MEGFSFLFPYIYIQRSGEFNGEKVQNLNFLDFFENYKVNDNITISIYKWQIVLKNDLDGFRIFFQNSEMTRLDVEK